MSKKFFHVVLCSLFFLGVLVTQAPAAVDSPATSFYQKVSDWAKPEIERANNLQLIPGSVRGLDLTEPVTREEFAAISVALYEKLSGLPAEAEARNPFSDTIDSDVLKAYKLGIISGVTPTTFEPNYVSNREQVATMISRTIRVIYPKGDYTYAGVAPFSDQADISTWAVEHVMYMTKLGIITGVDGKFMPKAITSNQKRVGYGNCTREAAIILAVRTYEQFR